MTIELIPVIEIGYGNQGLTSPDKYPYWLNSEVWDNYHDECFKKAGFKDRLTPYLKGISFYKLSDITESNLNKLTIDHTQEMRDGKWEHEQVCAFFGGYVLQIDGQDKYFPQCCGDLSDIIYWDLLSNGKHSCYEEHPATQKKFEDKNIVFDFSVDEFDERFQPIPALNILSISRFELEKAVEKAKTELKAFKQRFNKIEEDEKLNIHNIGGLLIYDNENYE